MPRSAYSKKRIPVQVCFALQDGQLDTLEGPVSYRRGDALVTGVEGERWPIPRGRFEATYSPVGPGGAMGVDGQFAKVPLVVQAERTPAPRSIPLDPGRGMLHAKAGDWIVSTPDGETWVVDHEIFGESYSSLDPMLD